MKHPLNMLAFVTSLGINVVDSVLHQHLTVAFVRSSCVSLSKGRLVVLALLPLHSVDPVKDGCVLRTRCRVSAGFLFAKLGPLLYSAVGGRQRDCS